MAVTLREMVTQVQQRLDQYHTNRQQFATFKGWNLDGGGNKIGIKLADVSVVSNLIKSDVELETEMVRVASYDEASSVATCPPWFRQLNGTPANDAFAVNSRVVINPRWPTYHVAQVVCEGIGNCYPDLFSVTETQLTSSAVSTQYELPAGLDVILNVTIEDYGPSKRQHPFWNFTVDRSNTDGKKYLRLRNATVAGRPIYVTYRGEPTVPDPATLSATWASTGLPSTAADIPVLYALMTLAPTVETAKTQTASVEQSDRNRLVQAGAGNSASRRYEELYTNRLKQERRKLLDKHPAKPHRTVS